MVSVGTLGADGGVITGEAGVVVPVPSSGGGMCGVGCGDLSGVKGTDKAG